MSRQFPARYEVTATHMGAGIADYSQRMNTHQATADEVLAQAQTDEAGVTCWASPQQLRIVAHEQQLAQECMQAMFDCGAIRTRALMKAYAHACWCKVRAVLVSNFDPKLQTLAQVADSFTALSLSHSSAPPGVKTAPNVLATCHASNAPGLSPIAMTYWQVTRLE
jgi:hypothetical protein